MYGDAKGYELHVSVRGLKDGKTILTNTGKSALSKKITDSGKEQQIEGQWADIQTWSTEDPNLYVARLELKSPEGKVIQTRETRITMLPTNISWICAIH